MRGNHLMEHNIENVLVAVGEVLAGVLVDDGLDLRQPAAPREGVAQAGQVHQQQAGVQPGLTEVRNLRNGSRCDEVMLCNIDIIFLSI